MDLLTECRSCWSGGTLLAAVPANRPRVVIPVADGRTMFASAGFLPASRPAARAYRGLVRLRMLSARGLRTIPATGGLYSDLLDDIEMSVGAEARDAVLLNSAGLKQSLTVRHVDETGRPCAFTKVGISESSRALVANEFRVLQFLNGRHAPELVVEAGSRAVTSGLVCTNALAGKPLAYNADSPDGLETCFLQTGEAQSIENHPWIRARLDGWESALKAPLVDLASRERYWPVCVSHGDAAPWNAFRSPDGSLKFIDWEYGAIEGLGALDRAHWTAQVDHLIHRRRPEVAARHSIRSVAASEDLDVAASAGVCGLMALDVRDRHSDPAVASWWLDLAQACILLGGDAR